MLPRADKVGQTLDPHLLQWTATLDIHAVRKYLSDRTHGFVDEGGDVLFPSAAAVGR